MDQRGVVNTLTMNKECKVVDYHWTSRDKLMLLAKDDTKNLCQILRTDCSSELVTLDEVSPTATLIRMYNDKLFTCYTNGSLLIHPNLTI